MPYQLLVALLRPQPRPRHLGQVLADGVLRHLGGEGESAWIWFLALLTHWIELGGFAFADLASPPIEPLRKTPPPKMAFLQLRLFWHCPVAEGIVCMQRFQYQKIHMVP